MYTANELFFSKNDKQTNGKTKDMNIQCMSHSTSLFVKTHFFLFQIIRVNCTKKSIIFEN